MRPLEGGFLAIRCLSLYAFLQVIMRAGEIVRIVYGIMGKPMGGSVPSETAAAYWSALPLFLLCACGVGLWTGAGALASRMTCDSGDEESGRVPGQPGLLTLAVSLLGLYVVVSAASEMVGYAGMLVARAGGYGYAGMAASLFKCIVGVWMVVGARSLVRVVMRSRQYGVNAGSEGKGQDEDS